MVPVAAPRRVVVFDLGGVLLQWNPRFLYRKLFDGDEAAMEHFLATVCTEEWNERQDAGRSFAVAVAETFPPLREAHDLLNSRIARDHRVAFQEVAAAVRTWQ